MTGLDRPFIILQASDFHVGSVYRPEVGDALVRWVQDTPCDLLALAGDYTQRAKPGEFQEFASLLDRMGDRPTVLTPGNHDVPVYRVFERLVSPFRNYRRFISEHLDSVIRTEGATVVALCSVAPRRAIVNGRIRPRQLEFAARAFADAPDTDMRIVVTHHAMVRAPDYIVDHPLPGVDHILRRFRDMGVDLVLSGHLHRAFTASSLDIYPHEAPEGPIWLVYSGSATSSRGRARESGENTVNRIEVHQEHLVVEHYIYLRDLGSFEPFERRTAPRRGAAGGPLLMQLDDVRTE